MYCSHCMEQIPDDLAVCPACGQTVYTDVMMHHLTPGTILNEKYLVGKVLGEGGFGITYIGRDINLDMKIAIKEYFPNGYANRNNAATNTVTITARQTDDYYSKGKTRFLQEARILAKFSHDSNIVNVRDFFEFNNTAYIIMEYLEGLNLKQYLKEYGKQDAVSLVQWFIPILRVLGKIHSQGLVHRDISPDNIIVENGNLILIDFGAAREVESNKSLSVVLKPGYAPGEQYYTHGNQGPWTDIYAICATMYKCITGVTPPESSERLFEDNLVSPSEMGIVIPRYIEAALMKGLSNRYQERQPNMETLISDLTSDGIEGVSVNRCEVASNNPVTVHITTDDPSSTIVIADAVDADDKNCRTGHETSGSVSANNDDVSRVREPSDIEPVEVDPGKLFLERDVKKRQLYVIAASAGVAVIILILLICLARKGDTDKIPNVPTTKQVLSSVSADGSIHDTITAFDVADSKINRMGTTYTAVCSVETEKGSYTVSVIYELIDEEWQCTQVIVKENPSE